MTLNIGKLMSGGFPYLVSFFVEKMEELLCQRQFFKVLFLQQ